MSRENLVRDFLENLSKKKQTNITCYNDDSILVPTYFGKALYSKRPVFSVAGLNFEDVGHHFGEEWLVGASVESTEVHQFREVKQVVLVDEVSVNSRAEVVCLEVCVCVCAYVCV